MKWTEKLRQQAEDYATGILRGKERELFEKEMAHNPDLYNWVREEYTINFAIANPGLKDFLGVVENVMEDYDWDSEEQERRNAINRRLIYLGLTIATVLFTIFLIFKLSKSGIKNENSTKGAAIIVQDSIINNLKVTQNQELNSSLINTSNTFNDIKLEIKSDETLRGINTNPPPNKKNPKKLKPNQGVDSLTIIAKTIESNIKIRNKDFAYNRVKVDYLNTALVLGGLDFDESELDTTFTDFIEMQLKSKPFKKGISGDNWAFLEGTQKEAEAIQKLLTQKSYAVSYLTGKHGTEHTIKRFNGKKSAPRILHIATHGFFLKKQKEIPNVIAYAMNDTSSHFSEDPLSRTGLILSGANKAWQGHSPPLRQEDGILTAYEISHLDLSETELVVLSACESGLGNMLQSNEGVYGLQRGFKMAGVKYLIMSLWKVPDDETQEMMVLFYRKWLEEKMEIPDAFRAAQKAMREKYEEEPYKWAGFILVE